MPHQSEILDPQSEIAFIRSAGNAKKVTLIHPVPLSGSKNIPSKIIARVYSFFFFFDTRIETCPRRGYLSAQYLRWFKGKLNCQTLNP